MSADNCPESKSSSVDIGKLQYLERIAETSDILEKWLSKNVGDNADWPVKIITDTEHAAKLSTLLNDLVDALAPYRKFRDTKQQ